MDTRVKVDLAKPFVGTPAADWSDGEAGIVLPAATAVNDFSAQKVGQALTTAREAFIAAFLDRRVIQDNNVEVLAALYAPDARQDQREDPGNRVRIAPGFRLLPASPKVTGSISVESGEKGELKIRANYSIAYAFDIDDPRRIEDVMDIVAVVRFEWQFIYRDGSTFEPSSRGLWNGDSTSHYYSMACKPLEQDMLAPSYSERNLHGRGASDEDVARMFDPSKPMPTSEGNC
ncbi:hypothetical protein [Kibdelosporangium philippinense]